MALPAPVPGLVISCEYLWSPEQTGGKTEAIKARPCVIVLRVERLDERVRVAVAPITHRQPDPKIPALEIPLRVKEHLGLDADRSWIVLNEINEFGWPGFYLRPIRRGSQEFAYGYLPPRLFRRVVTLMRETWRTSGGKIVSRD
jgi:mRNA-degrading endonuclease toxin of MazEF toxin-antitoxin module